MAPSHDVPEFDQNLLAGLVIDALHQRGVHRCWYEPDDSRVVFQRGGEDVDSAEETLDLADLAPLVAGAGAERRRVTVEVWVIGRLSGTPTPMKGVPLPHPEPDVEPFPAHDPGHDRYTDDEHQHLRDPRYREEVRYDERHYDEETRPYRSGHRSVEHDRQWADEREPDESEHPFAHRDRDRDEEHHSLVGALLSRLHGDSDDDEHGGRRRSERAHQQDSRRHGVHSPAEHDEDEDDHHGILDRLRHLGHDEEAEEDEDDWHAVRPLLRAVIRPAGFTLSDSQAPDDRLVSRPLAPMLREYLVIDFPTSMGYVSVGELRDWDVSAEEAFRIGRENVAELTPRIRPEGDRDPDDPRFWRLHDDGSMFTTSQLLVEGWLEDVAETLGIRPLAFAPDRYTLLIASADDVVATTEAFALVEREFRAAEQPVSPQGYVAEGSRLAPLRTKPGRPLTVPVRRATRLLAAHVYGGQAEQLRRIRRHPEWIAGLALFEHGKDGLFTVSTYAHGVPTLLPRADRVALVDEHDEILVVPWSAVERELHPELVERTDPPRYRLTDWPDAKALDALRGAAKALARASRSGRGHPMEEPPSQPVRTIPRPTQGTPLPTSARATTPRPTAGPTAGPPALPTRGALPARSARPADGRGRGRPATRTVELDDWDE